MSFPTFRVAATFALLPCLLATACSSQPPAAQAYANVTIGPAPASAGGKCNFMSQLPFLVLGTPGQTPTRVSDGVGTAHVTCSVTPSAGGTFKLQLSAASSAPMGGTMTIVGQVDPKSGGQNLTATFVGSINGSANGDYSSMACTVTYTYMNGVVPLNEPPVAPGRVWAHISCLDAQRPDVMNMGMPLTCDAEGDFVFENCGS
jgi:hypothetical protein